MRVQPDPRYCLGCRRCEIFCAANHDGYQGKVLVAFKRGRPLSRSLLVGDNQEWWFNTCAHCPDAPCIKACISGALRQDEAGVVYLEEDRCVGCYTCTMACPQGHIRPHPQLPRVVKCDLCRERGGIPACIEECPNGALRLVEGA